MLDEIGDHVGILWKDEVYNTVYPTIRAGVGKGELTAGYSTTSQNRLITSA